MEAVLHEELREACTEGDLAAVRALIHAGADVTAKHASTGVEPLSYAAFHGRWEVAQLLMLHGASPEHAVEEAQRGGFLPLAEYLRTRRARYQREAQAAAIEAKRQKEGEVLARKARFQQQHNEREQRRRGELLAGQVQRAAEHGLLDEQRTKEKAARRAARQTLRKETLQRGAELAQGNAVKWGNDNSKVAALHARQSALEEEHRRTAAASRHHDFINGGGGRVPPGLSRNGLSNAPSGGSSGFGSSSQLRSRLSIEALMAEEPTPNQRVLETHQARRLLPPTLLLTPTTTTVPYYCLTAIYSPPLSPTLLRTRRSSWRSSREETHGGSLQWWPGVRPRPWRRTRSGNPNPNPNTNPNPNPDPSPSPNPNPNPDPNPSPNPSPDPTPDPHQAHGARQEGAGGAD